MSSGTTNNVGGPGETSQSSVSPASHSADRPDEIATSGSPASTEGVQDPGLGGDTYTPDVARARAEVESLRQSRVSTLFYDRIFLLAVSGQQIAPGIRRFDRLGDTYELVQNTDGSQRYVKQREGVHTWEDLENVIGQALHHYGPDDRQALEFEIDQYNFPTLFPPDDFLGRVAILAHHPVSLILNGDPMDPPTIYRFTNGSYQVYTSNLDQEAIHFWKNPKVQRTMQEYFREALPERRALADALRIVHTRPSMANATLGDYLEEVRLAFNRRVPRPEDQIPDNRRTEIFSRLETLRDHLRDVAREAIGRNTDVPPAALYWDPVTTLLRQHPASTDARNHVFSIGAGAMAAQLENTRHMMDIGALPLDMRLTGVDMNEALVWEINNRGTINFAFGQKNPLNPQGRKKVYLINHHQRNEYLEAHPAKVVYFNLKAKFLTDTMVDDELLAILDKSKPAMPIPAKAYDSKGRIPYLQAYRKMVEKGYQDLANRIVVEAGFFNAIDILTHDTVWMTFAAGNQEALDDLRRIYTPISVGEDGKAVWRKENGELISDLEFVNSVEMAAYLMAGGANKNFLTYYLARVFMRRVLELEDYQTMDSRVLYDMGNDLHIAKEENIQASESITARILPHYNFGDAPRIRSDHLWSPEGLRMDIRKCAPDDLKGLLAIRGRVHALLLIENPDKRLLALRTLIAEIVANKIKVQTEDGVRIVNAQGTRNARDGYIDEVIAYSFPRFREDGHPIAQGSFHEFRNATYPVQWTGSGAQEGRNGYPTLAAAAREAGITLDRLFYLSQRAYEFDDSIPIPGEVTRDAALTDERVYPSVEALTTPANGGGWNVPRKHVLADYNPSNLDTVWGFPAPWVFHLGYEINKINLELNSAHALLRQYSRIPEPRFFTVGLFRLRRLLGPLTPEHGLYPEVTRCLIEIREWIDNLYAFFNNGSGERAQETLSEEQLLLAAESLRATVAALAPIFGTVADTSDLLDQLRLATQDLFSVEAAINPEVVTRVGLRRGYHQTGRMSLANRFPHSVLRHPRTSSGSAQPVYPRWSIPNVDRGSSIDSRGTTSPQASSQPQASPRGVTAGSGVNREIPLPSSGMTGGVSGMTGESSGMTQVSPVTAGGETFVGNATLPTISKVMMGSAAAAVDLFPNPDAVFLSEPNETPVTPPWLQVIEGGLGASVVGARRAVPVQEQHVTDLDNVRSDWQRVLGDLGRSDLIELVQAIRALNDDIRLLDTLNRIAADSANVGWLYEEAEEIERLNYARAVSREPRVVSQWNQLAPVGIATQAPVSNIIAVNFARVGR